MLAPFRQFLYGRGPIGYVANEQYKIRLSNCWKEAIATSTSTSASYRSRPAAVYSERKTKNPLHWRRYDKTYPSAAPSQLLLKGDLFSPHTALPHRLAILCVKLRRMFPPMQEASTYLEGTLFISPSNTLKPSSEAIINPLKQFDESRTISSKRLSSRSSDSTVGDISLPAGILDHYADRATTLAAELTPKQASLILNTFTLYHYCPPKMLLELLEKHLLPKLPHALPQDMVLLLHSYANFKYTSIPLFKRICEEIPHKLPHFKTQHISCAANALWKSNYFDEPVFYELAEEVVQRSEQLTMPAIPILIHAFARIPLMHSKLWKTLLSTIPHFREQFQPLEMVTVCNAVSRIKNLVTFIDNNLLQLLEEEILFHLPALPPFAVAVSLNALTKFPNFRPVTLCEAITERFNASPKDLDALSAINLSQILAAMSNYTLFSSINTDASVFFNNVLIKVADSAKKELLNPQCISTIVTALAKMSFRDGNLMAYIAKNILQKLPDFTSQGLALVASGYARLNIRSPILFHYLAQEIVKQLPLFNGQGLSMVIRSYCEMGLANAEFIGQVAESLLEAMNELTDEDCYSVSALITSTKNPHGDAVIEKHLHSIKEALLERKIVTPYSLPLANQQSGVIHSEGLSSPLSDASSTASDKSLAALPHTGKLKENGTFGENAAMLADTTPERIAALSISSNQKKLKLGRTATKAKKPFKTANHAPSLLELLNERS